jgi:hypothetical protein
MDDKCILDPLSANSKINGEAKKIIENYKRKGIA